MKTILVPAVLTITSVLLQGCAQAHNPQTQRILDEALIAPVIIEQKPVSYTSDKPVVMFILDTSYSMTEIENGDERIQTAKKSITDTTSQIDSNRFNTGLITFDQIGSCKAVLSVPPGNNDPEAIANALDQVEPSGRTPLAAALALSVEVLEKVDKKMVVVFSDGLESCNGDPVKQAKILDEKYGIKINLQVVGYAVDQSTARQLREIAQVNEQWAYHEAKDAESLEQVIDDITRQGALLDPLWQNISTFSFQFESGSADLGNEYLENIAKIHSYLKRNQRNIVIIGHTDSVGSEEANLALSRQRAGIVKSKLVEMGVAEFRIQITGKGEAAPISSNDTDAGKRKNRRVVIRVE